MKARDVRLRSEIDAAFAALDRHADKLPAEDALVFYEEIAKRCAAAHHVARELRDQEEFERRARGEA